MEEGLKHLRLVLDNNFDQMIAYQAIVELPPILRASFENIIFNSSWTGSQPDFNLWLQKYNEKIDLIIRNGFKWQTIKFELKIHAIIADSRSRSKICNSIQFNGYYGCIKCMHPGIAVERVVVYPNLPHVKLRTNSCSNLQAETAEKSSVCFKGIKGFTYISNWISIPNDVIYDYMHLCLIGIIFLKKIR
ncbi:hypothetical protein BpHYR1_023064 [Brachionus plicatilis]|uniref:Uncharacterized protein n=1 Tax=Brachionus plicatilis TaxID=10195 RepID=A0A3M7SIG4_BRAPC|nr:hypothetical protein BpHYR1_023064 [Brachionus plicatilis]